MHFSFYFDKIIQYICTCDYCIALNTRKKDMTEEIIRHATDVQNDLDETVQNDTGEIQTFVIPVVWQEAGQFVVRARTLKEAIDAIEGNDGDRFGTANANGEYIDDSFEINRECIQTIGPEEMYAFSDDYFVDLSLGKNSQDDEEEIDEEVEEE